MHLRTRTWFAISFCCFLVALVFWQWAERLAQRQREATTARGNGAAPAQSTSNGADPSPRDPAAAANAAATNASPAAPASVPGAAQTNSAARKEPFPYRVSNTPRTVDDLSRSDPAILLRNALIDSSAPIHLAIPPHLRSQGDPGAYVVQARGPLTDGFRARLGQAGAQIISYVPNNAYLVRADAGAAKQLAAWPETQAVLPWEPYYKLEPKLLELAVEQKPLPADASLNLVVFADQSDGVRQALAQAGIKINGESRTPFGPMLAVRPPADSLPMLAALPGVQAIERLLPRKPVNDLARPRVKASADVGPATEVGSENYQNLTGAGVKVNVNDTGVDATHPGLTGRVTADSPFTLEDFDGHGTHVSGIIAGSGASGPNGKNVQGSFTNSNYRGMASSAQIFAMPIDLNFGPFTSEEYLQETAAANDANVSNNSWGYPGAQDYTFSSASWDAAARDALPGVTGSQPLTLVFAAGNSGLGEGDGSGGLPGSISAPATGKNVITVGATESYRNITNSFTLVMDDNGEMVTNIYQPFLGFTDSSNQITSFSSRGNVGAGIEGEAGRFKPDVVAPGAMIVSARSSQAALPDSLTNVIVNNIFDQTLLRGQTNLYAVFVPANGFRLVIQVLSNSFSPSPFPGMIISVSPNSPPTPGSRSFINTADLTVVPGIYFYSIANTNAFDVRFDLRTQVIVQLDPPTGYFEVLRELNESVAPNYRFESGTSQATPVVTGLIALMQEFFRTTFNRTNSPALTKALLINGARTLSSEYNYQIDPTVNLQGWGLVNLTNSIPQGVNTVANGDDSSGAGRLIFFDQSPARALNSGQSVTRILNVPPTASDFPVRITLAWTDPPGNPSVGIKLVNDLDLIVTNLSNGQVYVGNHFAGGEVFTSAIASNTAVIPDRVNNVENVFLNRGLNERYSVTVRARRVNVNAVTEHPDGIVQDYALVISTERPDGGLSLDPEVAGNNPAPLLTFATNGTALLNNLVGANSPLIVSTNGASNQWHFFVVTNQLPPSDPNFGSGVASHIAFTTFLPPNLSRPRSSDEADIDLYVSADPAITNLNTAVINSAFKSRKRGGTESVVIDNAIPGLPYYAGVKSEDQQAANFGFFAISSSTPFSNTDSNGNVTAIGYPRRIDIPDGTSQRPQAALVFAFVTDQVTVDNVVVTNRISHDSGGDLFGNFSHNNHFAVLNNHRPFQGNNLEWVYDESDSGEIPNSRPVDGPGSLRSFVGEEGTGVWQLTMIDNSPFHTGRVDFLSVTLAPHLDEGAASLVGITRRILPGRWTYTFVDVPAQATNLSVCVKPQGGPVEVYLRRGAFPSLTQYDKAGAIPIEGGCVDLGRRDSPPLSQGRYIIGVFNPNLIEVVVNIKITLELDLNRKDSFTFRSGGAQPILDDAVTTSVVHVNQSREIADLSVGVRIDHPRVSDLVLHLVSPSGTRLLLAENRGGPDGKDYGSGLQQTNTFPVQTSGGAAANTNVLGVSDTEGTIEIQYQFFTVGDTLRIYYEGNVIFDSKLTSGGGVFSVDYGPGLATNIVIVVNEGNNPNGTTLWNYTATVLSGYNYATFTENTSLAPELIKFAVPPFAPATTPPVSNFLTGFETVAPGLYSQGAMFDNWTVTSNQVQVVSGSTNVVYEGQNMLTLAAGTVTRQLPTQLGRPYRLRFFTRDPSCLVSWWPGEIATPNVVTDVAGANSGVMSFNFPTTYTNSFTNGLVGDAFLFDGASTYISVSPSPDLGSTNNSGMTIECWVKPEGGVANQPILEWNSGGVSGVHFWIGGIGGLPGGGGPGSLYADLVDTGGTNHVISTGPGVVTDNSTNFQHIALTYHRTSGVARLYYNGLLVASNMLGTFTAQTTYPLYLGYRAALPVPGPYYRGLLDEVSVYKCALTEAEIYGIYAAGANGKCGPTIDCSPVAQLTLNGVTSPIYGTSVWTATSIPFTALTNGTTMKLEGAPLSLDFDSFELTEYAGGGMYLAEESLKPLFGENAAGDWKLEVWDNRAGMPIPDATLLAWKLNLTFVNTNPAATTLTNGLAFCGTLGTNETAFFKVITPVNSSGVTNTFIAENNIKFSFNQTGLPTGQQPPDTLWQDNVASGISVIDTNGWRSYDLNRNLRFGAASPKLLPGRVYYLAVENLTSSSNSYCLQVDFDVAGAVVTLANNVPICGSLGFTVPPAAISAQYFVFNVSPGAVQATFQTFNASSNVDLFLQYGMNFTNLAKLLSLATNYPYASTNLGVTNEIIRVTTNTAPFALTNGPWYLAVVNRDRTNASYCIVAKQILGSDIFPLTNGAPYVRTNDGGGIGPAVPVDYFHFPVSANSRRAQFEILRPAADVTLVLKKNLPLPDLLNATEISARGGGSDELIYLLDFSTPIPLTPGDWYLGIVNSTGTEVRYTAQATEYPVYGTNFNFSSSQVVTGSLCLTWTNTLPDVNYHVLVANAVAPPFWLPMPPSIRATTNQVIWCTPLPSSFSVFRLNEGLVPTLYPALANLDGTPVPTNGFTVRWSAPADQTFLLEGSELLTPPSWQTLTNNFSSTNGLFEYFDGPQTNGVRPYRFYRFYQLP